MQKKSIITVGFSKTISSFSDKILKPYCREVKQQQIARQVLVHEKLMPVQEFTAGICPRH